MVKVAQLKRKLPKPADAPLRAQMGDKRPLLVIDDADRPAAARQLAKHLAAGSFFFQRATALVKVAEDGQDAVAKPINQHDVVNYAHLVCRPVKEKIVGGEITFERVTLPNQVAQLYLNLHDKWGTGNLQGICRAPILSDDGSIRAAQGYDAETGFWCIGIELPNIPMRPSRQQAEKALARLRRTFATFPFRDANFVNGSGRKQVVDLSKPPGADESTHLAAILTAVSRPSLALAPGFVFCSPQYSGAGVGKGKLVRAIARIAYNVAPSPFTTAGDRKELDKRLTAALVSAHPVIFLDNVNSEVIKSNLLAQIATENPCGIRPFGNNTNLVSVPTNAFLGITGNAIRIAEDLTRRFLFVNLDARCEDPESRSFDGDFLASIQRSRTELLAAALTVWRWGRLNRLKPGLPLGSFEQWAAWCRDPLIALGCADPVARIVDAKRDDPDRQQMADFLREWHALYGERQLTINELDMKLRQLADGHGGTRQKFQTFVASLAGTRAAGFVLVKHPAIGKWSPAKYSLKSTDQ